MIRLNVHFLWLALLAISSIALPADPSQVELEKSLFLVSATIPTQAIFPSDYHVAEEPGFIIVRRLRHTSFFIPAGITALSILFITAFDSSVYGVPSINPVMFLSKAAFASVSIGLIHSLYQSISHRTDSFHFGSYSGVRIDFESFSPVSGTIRDIAHTIKTLAFAKQVRLTNEDQKTDYQIKQLSIKLDPVGSRTFRFEGMTAELAPLGDTSPAATIVKDANKVRQKRRFECVTDLFRFGRKGGDR